MDSFVGLSVEEFLAKLAEHNKGKGHCPHCYCWMIITPGPVMAQCCLCGALEPMITRISGMPAN